MEEDSLCTKVRLTISAKNLRDADIFSKSDPMCVVYLSSSILRGEGKFREIGRTETIKNCLNPEWNTKILLDYYFEEEQKLRLEVYDIDSASTKLSDHDFLGSVDTTIAEIVGASYSRKTFLLEDRHSKCGRRGELTVVADEAEGNENRQIVNFLCHAIKVDKKDFFGKSDPFLNIYRINDDGMKHLVHRTEVIKNTLNPTWSPFELTMQQICAGDPQRKIIIECYDYDNDGGHDYIGTCETNIQRLIDQVDVELPLINDGKKKRKGKRYTHSGLLHFDYVKVRQIYSFLDYIKGGTQLDFAVAIDMTASNGDPNEPGSLHYLHGLEPNEYQIAIHAVADICQHYSKTKIFDAIGFGAKIRGAQPPVIQHCFPLNLMTNSYEVLGVPNLMEAYQLCINGCILYGPTNFNPLITRIAQKVARYPKDGSRYQVLLIITDGCICDFEATKDAIVSASYLPLSIIIVGVGTGNFDKMNFLDSDDRLLMSKGRKAQRDIVQFVELKKFLQKRNGSSSDYLLSMALLAKEVLAEIPEQLTSFMSINGIRPRPADDPFLQPSPSVDYPDSAAMISRPIPTYQNVVDASVPQTSFASTVSHISISGKPVAKPNQQGFSGVSMRSSAFEPQSFMTAYGRPESNLGYSSNMRPYYPNNMAQQYNPQQQYNASQSYPAKGEPPPPYSYH